MYLISGMHRSGTSLVARFFHEAGGDLGDPATFHAPDRWNPDGYFEQPDIHAINMPLINGPWGRLAYFRLPSTALILQRAAPLADLIRQTSQKYEDKIVKENRFCLTLPAWLQHGATVDGLVICLRHPTAVARSLRRRNWITIGLAYRLWTTHLERLLEHSRDIPTWLVRYENILEQELVSGELRNALQAAGLSCPDERIGQLHANLVRPDSRPTDHDIASCPPAVSRLWDELLERHASQR